MLRSISTMAAGGSVVGALVGMLALTVPAAAQGASSRATDISSQHDPRISAAKGIPRQGAGPRGPVGPPGGFRAPGPRGPAFNPNAAVAPRFQGPRGPVVAPGYRGPSVGVVAPGFRGPVGTPGYRRPPVGVVSPGFRGPAVGWRGPSWRGGSAAFIRGRHYVRRGGLILPLIGLGALSAIYVGSQAYTPYAYVDAPDGGLCEGPTDDGVCELRMTEVPLESGGAALQCVAYCPPQ